MQCGPDKNGPLYFILSRPAHDVSVFAMLFDAARIHATRTSAGRLYRRIIAASMRPILSRRKRVILNVYGTLPYNHIAIL